LSAASYGEHQPTAGNDTPEGKRENRRIEVIIVPDLSLLPGYDELQTIVQAP
jgi:chemotaxis protein MotB